MNTLNNESQSSHNRQYDVTMHTVIISLHYPLQKMIIDKNQINTKRSLKNCHRPTSEKAIKYDNPLNIGAFDVRFQILKPLNPDGYLPIPQKCYLVDLPPWLHPPRAPHYHHNDP